MTHSTVEKTSVFPSKHRKSRGTQVITIEFTPDQDKDYSCPQPKLQHLRFVAHKYFDPIWQQEQNRKQARGKAYRWLARQLRIETSKCHIAMFDIRQCQRTIALCRTFRKNRLHLH